MIGYGQAFVIGWLFFMFAGLFYNKRTAKPWSYKPIIWGVTFVVLNWISSLG